MQGNEVHEVLQRIGAMHLYHANTVTTSCTFLEQGGLLSRYFVEEHNLAQTPQYSDADDKRYNIWHCIFLDHVDIHARAGRKKGPNQYGPVLFVLELDILLGLPKGSKVFVTKCNPIHWQGKPNNERWFQDVDELQASVRLGDFNKIVVIEAPSGKIDFPAHRAQIVLDDPKKNITSGKDAYMYAEMKLKNAATTGQVSAYIKRRECLGSGCICTEKYEEFKSQDFDVCFT